MNANVQRNVEALHILRRHGARYSSSHSALSAAAQAANTLHDDFASSVGGGSDARGTCSVASAIDEEGVPAIVRAAGDGDAHELRRLLVTLPTSSSMSVQEELDSVRIIELNGHNINEPNANGIDLDHWNDHGQTAMIKAVRNNHPRCVDILLEAGASTTVIDSKFRSAWYYSCFGVNIPKGAHKTMVKRLTKALIETKGAHAITSEIILCTCYTRNEGVTWAVLDALKCEVTSKDSTGKCEFLFHDLHILDNPTAVMTWPDGSTTNPGETAGTCTYTVLGRSRTPGIVMVPVRFMSVHVTCICLACSQDLSGPGQNRCARAPLDAWAAVLEVYGFRKAADAT